MSAGDSEKSIEMLVLLVETQQKFEPSHPPLISPVRYIYIIIIIISVLEGGPLPASSASDDYPPIVFSVVQYFVFRLVGNS
jgi:hypothetical protein